MEKLSKLHHVIAVAGMSFPMLLATSAVAELPPNSGSVGGALSWYADCRSGVEAEPGDLRAGIAGVACSMYVGGLVDGLVFAEHVHPYARRGLPIGPIICPPADGQSNEQHLVSVLDWLEVNQSVVANNTPRTAVGIALGNLYQCQPEVTPGEDGK